MNEINFFCDENITKKIIQLIKSKNFNVTGIRELKLFGLSNGELLIYLKTKKYCLLTFDKDFVFNQVRNLNGIIVIEHFPNRDEFTLPLINRFLELLIKNQIDLENKTILLNDEYFQKT